MSISNKSTINMGNKHDKYPQFDFSKLRCLEKKENNCEVYQDFKRDVYDVYTQLADNETHLQNDIIRHQSRRDDFKNPDLNVVSLHHILPHQSQGMCSKSSLYKIVLEHIPKRLSQIGEEPEDKLLYILHDALNGYGHMFKRTKRADYQVTDEMVTFNSKNNVKVWHSQKLDSITPSRLTPIQYISAGGDLQENLIRSIFRTCQRHAQGKRFSQSFSDYKNVNMRLPYRFGDSINLIKKYVASKYSPGSQIVDYIVNSRNQHEDLMLGLPLELAQIIPSGPQLLTSLKSIEPFKNITFNPALPTRVVSTPIITPLAAPSNPSVLGVYDPNRLLINPNLQAKLGNEQLSEFNGVRHEPTSFFNNSKIVSTKKI